VGGDQFIDNRQRHVVDDPDPFFEVASGRGASRVVVVIGLLIVLVGFAMWMSVILTGFGGDEPTASQGFPPQAIAGFVLFGVGGIVTSLGTAWSRALRRQRDGW